MQLHADLCADVPAESRTDHPSAEMVVASFRVAQHDGEVFRDMIEHDKQRVLLADIGFKTKYGIIENSVILRQ